MIVGYLNGGNLGCELDSHETETKFFLIFFYNFSLLLRRPAYIKFSLLSILFQMAENTYSTTVPNTNVHTDPFQNPYFLLMEPQTWIYRSMDL